MILQHKAKSVSHFDIAECSKIEKLIFASVNPLFCIFDEDNVNPLFRQMTKPLTAKAQERKIKVKTIVIIVNAFFFCCIVVLFKMI